MSQWRVLELRRFFLQRFFRTRYVLVRDIDGGQVCFCVNGAPVRFQDRERAEAHVDWLNSEGNRLPLLVHMSLWEGWPP